MAKIQKYGLLQYDISKSSKWSTSGIDQYQMKKRVIEVLKGIISIYKGTIINPGGDGAVFMFPVYDSHICPMDWVAQAGIHCQRTIEFLNEPWNQSLMVNGPLTVRISCHLCDLTLEEGDLSNAHGDGLNWFMKYERNLGKANAVTITSDLHQEIRSLDLKNLFCEVLNPLKYRVHDKYKVKDLFIFDPNVPKNVILNWNEYWDSVKELANKLIKSKYIPDLIIGLARGGAVVGDLLSRLLDDTPFVSLWVDRPKDDDVRTPSIAKAFLDCDGFQNYIIQAEVRNILIVDDHCKTGDSLKAGRLFVESQLNGLKNDIRNSLNIKVAVLAKEQSFDKVRKVDLDYCLHDDMQMMPYGRG